jgi:hypothetical protein
LSYREAIVRHLRHLPLTLRGRRGTALLEYALTMIIMVMCTIKCMQWVLWLLPIYYKGLLGTLISATV